MPEHKSAFERLGALPAMFSLNTFVRATGLKRPVAKVTLNRWQSHGMVQDAGPRAGLYFNRVVDRKGVEATQSHAVIATYPSATLCGASVLHGAGWITQVPSALHVAIEERASYVTLHNVVLHPRPQEWFRSMHRHQAWKSSHDDFPSFGLRALSPAWALADIYADKSGNSWVPDEDDLDVLNEAQFLDALEAMEALPPSWAHGNAPGRALR